MTVADTLEGAGFDFSELDEEGAVEAKPGPLTGSRGTNRRTGSRRRPAAKKLETLQKRLSGEMFQAGTILGMALPVTGYYACQESDAFTKAVVELASKRAEWIGALEHLADIGPGITIGRTAVGLGAALAVDRGRIDPEDSRFLMFLGVTAAWNAVTNPDYEVEEGSGYTPPPAGAFVPVS